MEIILNIEDDSIRAPINPTLLEQALANLVDNAIKYSEAEKKIWISLARSGGEIALSVQDQGCGISKEHVSRIFERFYRVDKARSRKVGGTGLGLAIVKHIVRAHRGRLEVQSALGEGATFSIYLPKV
jgi:two-component system phosphate regulon sensor histidine kinase PhoR